MNCAPTQLVMKRLRYILKITEIPKVSNSVHYKSQKLYKSTKTSDAEFFKLNNYIILFCHEFQNENSNADIQADGITERKAFTMAAIGPSQTSAYM